MQTIKFPRHYRITNGQLDMAPLIDMVLNLLIYFMLTSSFLMQPGLKIKLPEAKTTEPGVAKPVVVAVTADDRIFFRDRQVSVEELKSALEIQSRQGRFILLVKGDESARHGLVVQVLDLARLSGAERLIIATSPEI